MKQQKIQIDKELNITLGKRIGLAHAITAGIATGLSVGLVVYNYVRGGITEGIKGTIAAFQQGALDDVMEDK